ncbi:MULTISPECIES: DUF6998 domain-containing protein [Flavobacterium]|uniref:DUF6998 domain-containing protein n=1 Tax=Flavobacterium TaxID=237 RepID=UPI0011831FBA|nr:MULTISPECIES: hypothetical protein [Flavobacterium]MCR4030447.1 hypothetical protein [Flavobacterium panacis]
MPELKNLTEKELLKLNSDIMDELKARKIIRTRNNPIADYCEWYVAEKFGWNLKNNSNSGYDAIDSENLRVQIKCRTLMNTKRSRQLGVIRKLDQDTFDYLIALLFDENAEVTEAYKISKGLIKKYAKFSKHQNGHILHVKGNLLNDEKLEDITELLK